MKIENKIKRTRIPNSVRMKVIRYFKNNSDNSSPTIAKHYGINVKTVNAILDKHLNKKFQKQCN